MERKKRKTDRGLGLKEKGGVEGVEGGGGGRRGAEGGAAGRMLLSAICGRSGGIWQSLSPSDTGGSETLEHRKRTGGDERERGNKETSESAARFITPSPRRSLYHPSGVHMGIAPLLFLRTAQGNGGDREKKR